MRILILDDDDRDVPAITDVWVALGHFVYQAKNVPDLQRALEGKAFNAFLIDLMIPALGLPAGECAAGFTTGEYVYREIIFPKFQVTPFAIFSAALIDLGVIAAARKRMSAFPGYRGFFEKGCKTGDLLKAISQ